MKVLVVGSGGREHALAWRFSRCASVHRVYVAPGNAGTALDKNLTNVAITDIAELADFAAKESIDLTVVGPEGPLSQGIVDLFRSRGLAIFGPTKAAAQLETSKDYAKSFMFRHHIPTAGYKTFSNIDEAHAYLDAHGAPIVVKADGLAAGKGVTVAMTLEEAHKAVDDMLEGHRFGAAGARVVIEDYLDGEEASFIVLTDGKSILPLASSQDHKRLLDHDEGPNTGGMGAYSPAPCVTPEIHAQVMREIIEPTVRGMQADGITYTGFLYAGLMICKDKEGKQVVKTLEFNCRMGDPETQPIMSRVRGDIASVLKAAAEDNLGDLQLEWDHRVALGVVLAAKGYPVKPEKGAVITGLPADDDAHHVFHAGTKLNDKGELVVSGGRVLCVVGLGDGYAAAQKSAYAAAEQIHFDGMQMRHDIGWRAIKHHAK